MPDHGAEDRAVIEPIENVSVAWWLLLAAPPPLSGALEVAGVAQAARNALDVGFTYEVRAFDRWAPGDALNPALYVISSSPSSPLPLLLSVAHVGPGVVRLFFDAAFAPRLTLTVTVDPSISPEDPLLPVGPILSATLALPTFDELGEPERIEVREARRDLRNAQTPGGDPLGTLAIGADGDYANEEGEAYFRKRILRRATTAARGFVLLPSYGFAPRAKGLVRPSELRAIRASITRQVLAEPDCSSASVSVAYEPGILTVTIRATMAGSGRTVNAAASIPFGG